MRFKFFLLSFICLLPLFPERLLYKAKSFIAPRKFVQNEISPEKKAERIRKLEAANDVCTDLPLDLNKRLPEKSVMEIIFIPEDLFRKFNGIFYSRKEFSYSLAARGEQSQIKRVCFNDNDSGFRTFKWQKNTTKEKGLHYLKFIAFDSNDRQIAYIDVSVYLDFVPPVLNATVGGNKISNGQSLRCRDGEFFKLDASDSEADLTHAYYRLKNTYSWKYYLDPMKLNSNGKISFEAMSEDIAGNQSTGIFFECDMEKF